MHTPLPDSLLMVTPERCLRLLARACLSGVRLAENRASRLKQMGWVEQRSTTGIPFFLHLQTRRVVWERPQVCAYFCWETPQELTVTPSTMCATARECLLAVHNALSSLYADEAAVPGVSPPLCVALLYLEG